MTRDTADEPRLRWHCLSERSELSREGKVTEAQWRDTTDPLALLQLLHEHGAATDRQLRLFECGCCRRIPWYAVGSHGAMMLDLAERYADGLITLAKAEATWEENNWSGAHWDVRRRFATLLDPVPGPLRLDSAHSTALSVTNDVPAEWAAHHAIIRCIFANPFAPVSFDDSWSTGDCLAMARGMYETRDFGAMPILADALQDAGCEHEGVLDHCRKHPVHVRGCFGVDELLQKR
jgi:hypothetical protein